MLRSVISTMTVPKSVLLFSPANDLEGYGREERTALSAVWPSAVIEECHRWRWDLDNEKPAEVPHCDVGIICNTFMASRDPTLWLRHISMAVPILIIQDLSVCMRERDRHCSVKTGDVARYSVSSHGIIGQTDPELSVFDLSAAGYDVLSAVGYGPGTFIGVLRLSKDNGA